MKRKERNNERKQPGNVTILLRDPDSEDGEMRARKPEQMDFLVFDWADGQGLTLDCRGQELRLSLLKGDPGEGHLTAEQALRLLRVVREHGYEQFVDLLERASEPRPELENELEKHVAQLANMCAELHERLDRLEQPAEPRPGRNFSMLR